MRTLIACALSLLLLSCGFHLRGLNDTPAWLQDVAVVAQKGNPDFIAAIRNILSSNHVRLAASRRDARYVLLINNTQRSQNITSVSASSNPRQYELGFRVFYTLIDAKSGQTVRGPGQIYVTRQLTVNVDRILGSDQEADIIFTDMQRDAAVQLLNRLSRQTHVTGNR